MKHFCSKTREIEKRLEAKGVELGNAETMSPEEKYAEEIELPKEVSLEKANYISQMKSKTVIQQGLKQKEME